MSTYILLSKLTAEGRKTIKDRPDRIREVDKELENMNVRVVEQYATLGPYDFVNIVEAPDNETISKVSVDLCSRGTVEIMTLAAISVDSFISSLGTGKKTGKAGKAKTKSGTRRK
ncbi:MAG TPA: GYD domain-containing protein [Thermodesulfobacteriota bacterium]|nr:GYD domain-containing protein [Thermodesulfobacteriota bacterium]